MPIGEGASLGTAQGAIIVDTRGVTGAQATVQAAAVNMERSLGRMAAGAKKAQGGFAGLGKGVGGITDQFRKLDSIVGASLLIGGAVVAWRGARGLATTASDLTESINKTAVAFSSSKDAVLEWSKNSATALGQSRQQALEGASSFGMLFATMKLAPAVSAEMSMSLVQLATDMASINNATPDEALTKLRAGLVGEAEPLRVWGVLLDAANTEAKAMEMGLAATTKALTQQDKVLARYQLILEQTAIQQGDFANTSGEFAGQMKIAEAASKDAQAALGLVVQQDVLEMTQAYANTLKDITFWLDRIRGEGGEGKGVSIGTRLLQFGGWKLPGQKESEDAAHEAAVLTGLLGKAREGLVNLQNDAEQGMLNEAAIERQIALIHDFEQAIISAKNAGGVARVTLSSRLMGGVGNYSSIRQPARFAGTEGAAQLDLIRDRFTGLQDIERDANAARLDATRQYEEQRTSTIRDYGKTLARDAEDAGRARVRAEQEFASSIADVRQDALRREADQAEDFARVTGQARADADERIADARADANERLAEIEEDYQKDRERAAGDHRDKLMDAASRLDAVAIFEEQKRFARESADAKEAHDEQRGDLTKQLAERIADEEKSLAKSNRLRQEAYDRQLADVREADAERIADMQADFTKRKAQEDEDRALRLGRMAADHNDQLAEMDRQHALDLQQIAAQEAEQRAKLQEEFETEMAALDVQTGQRIAKYTKLTDAAIKDFDRWFDHMADRFAQPGRPTFLSEEGPMVSRASGGPVPYTGPIFAHQGEFVLSRAMLAAGRGGATFTGNVSVNINGGTNMGSGELYAVARRALVDALTEMAGQ